MIKIQYVCGMNKNARYMNPPKIEDIIPTAATVVICFIFEIYSLAELYLFESDSEMPPS